jgi:hypothetical protein
MQALQAYVSIPGPVASLAPVRHCHVDQQLPGVLCLLDGYSPSHLCHTCPCLSLLIFSVTPLCHTCLSLLTLTPVFLTFTEPREGHQRGQGQGT